VLISDVLVLVVVLLAPRGVGGVIDLSDLTASCTFGSRPSTSR
jgi:hypothetical protein